MFFPSQDLIDQLNDAMHDLAFDINGIGKCRLKLDKATLNSLQIPAYNFNLYTALYIKKD